MLVDLPSYASNVIYPAAFHPQTTSTGVPPVLPYATENVIPALDNYRSARDGAVRLAETLNDEAFQMEQEAALILFKASQKRQLSANTIREVNEDVPVSTDPDAPAFPEATTVPATATKAARGS